MVRRLTLDWPDRRPFADRDDRPIRWLAVSDDLDPALEYQPNREALGPIDGIIGCGDLEPDYLGFLGDAFHVPLSFVRGNHDHGARWAETLAARAPRPLPTARVHRLHGLPTAALEWPGIRHHDRRRHDGTAWADSVLAYTRRAVATLRGTRGPMVVISHAPPRGLGDRAADPYHVGYEGYRWLLERWRPPLWLHGHVPPASVEGWRVRHGPTEVVNVTGAVLIEFRPPDAAGGATPPTA